jgi:hypothetical protein
MRFWYYPSPDEASDNVGWGYLLLEVGEEMNVRAASPEIHIELKKII